MATRNFFFKAFEIPGAQTAHPSEPDLEFCFQALGVTIVNDSNVRIFWGFKKNAEDGYLNKCDRVSFDHLGEGRIWFKLGSSSPNKKIVRVWAWRM